MTDPITILDFKKLEFRTAKVMEVTAHPNADRLLVVKVDIGGGETRQMVAGIRASYTPEQLLGKNVIVLVNLPSAMLRGIESQGMILAASAEGAQAVLTTDRELPAGSRVS